MTPKRSRFSTRTVALAFLSVALFLVSGVAHAQSSVYILTGGNSSSDQSVVEALTAAGFNVTVGVQTPTWNATQANLGNYDALVMLNNLNWRGDMAQQGAESIRDYINNGGGVITGEWLTYKAQTNSVLAEFLPTVYTGFNESCDTDFILDANDDVISDGLSARFNLKKGFAEGSESHLMAKNGAKTFFKSSASNAAGLAGWDFGKGRVLTFSNIFTGMEIDNRNLQKLVVNAANWAKRKKTFGGDGGDGPAVTPEGTSIAMLAAGALPFGFLWARSRRRRRVEEIH